MLRRWFFVDDAAATGRRKAGADSGDGRVGAGTALGVWREPLALQCLLRRHAVVGVDPEEPAEEAPEFRAEALVSIVGGGGSGVLCALKTLRVRALASQA